tara:strand:- start:440 stop:994 length:555 start_codon:yes stop_codon:yes gene_type:complete
MTGALLSEVWPDMVQKPRKSKRLKKKKTEDPLFDAPLTPDEMETELLDDRPNPELDPNKRLKGMRVSPYTNDENQYQDTKRTVDLNLNDNIVRSDTTRNIVRESLADDPDYAEFLEFKRMKARQRGAKLSENKQREIKSLVSKRPLETPYEEQFNELLLYVFTGFFLLMIYDNIYKLGKETTFY